MAASSDKGSTIIMDRDEALRLLRGGPEGIQEWNRQRTSFVTAESLGTCPSSIDFSQADLSHADLSGAFLNEAKLAHADFRESRLNRVNLYCADLTGAKLSRSFLERAVLEGANLNYADLTSANLYGADCLNATLAHSVLRDACLYGTSLRLSKLDKADVTGATFAFTVVACDLSATVGLDDVHHLHPSFVDIDSLFSTRGSVSEKFLRGCGLQPWEILTARLSDPALTPGEIADLQYKIFDARTKALFLGGVFISYSHADAAFVDKLHDRLEEKKASVWLDRHDLVAGDLQKQVGRAIRFNDIVLLVLSEASVESDWVEHELEMARKKEKEEGRDVLCPIALDDAWKAKMNDVLWRQVKKKNVLDFSKWETDAFEEQFQKLLTGMKIYYPRGAEADDSENVAT